MSTPSDDLPTLAVALKYAASGWPVFPCSPANKQPLVLTGFKAATTDPQQVEAWWQRYPDAMIGVPTGARSGLWVLDVDVKGGVDGRAELVKLETQYGTLPETVTVNTPSGGVHYLFKYADGVRNRGSLTNGIDVRGEGGYVIAAGSVNADGNSYEWGNTPQVLAEANNWLLSKVRKQSNETVGRIERTAEPKMRYVEAAIASELSNLVRVTHGRNNALNDSAFALGTFVGAGVLSRAEAEARLYAAAEANGYVSKDGPDAARKTIESGLASGQANPRQVPEKRGRDPELIAESNGIAERFEAAKVALKPAAAAEDDGDLLAASYQWIDPRDVPVEPSANQTGVDAASAAPEVNDQFLGQVTSNHQAGATNPTVKPSPDFDLSNERSAVPAAIRLSEWEGKPVPEREWLLEGLIPHRQVTLLSGDGGVGKSLFALQLGIATALGVETVGLSPKHGRCLYLGAEDEADEFHRRARDIVEHFGRALGELDDFLLLPMAGLDAVLASPDERGQLATTAVWRSLREYVADFRPLFVQLDTSADLFGGDEIKRAQVRRFIGLLKGIAIEHDCAVMLLSHPSLTGIQSGTGLSGSTAWNNSVRSRLYMQRVIEDQRETGAISLTNKKANYGPRDFKLLLRWQDGVFVREEHASPAVVELLDNLTDKKFLELLSMIVGQGQHVSPNRSSSYAPSVLSKHPDANGFTKRDFDGSMQRLLKSEKVTIVEDGPPSKLRKRLVPAPKTLSTNDSSADDPLILSETPPDDPSEDTPDQHS